MPGRGFPQSPGTSCRHLETVCIEGLHNDMNKRYITLSTFTFHTRNAVEIILEQVMRH